MQRTPRRPTAWSARAARIAGLALALGCGASACASWAPREGDLDEVNHEVNRSIRWRAEPDGEDVTRFGPREGDCEDYAATKMIRLAARGWRRQDMRLARVTTGARECHAVLLVRASGRVMVLDNRYASPQPQAAVAHDGYRFDDCRGAR